MTEDENHKHVVVGIVAARGVKTGSAVIPHCTLRPSQSDAMELPAGAPVKGHRGSNTAFHAYYRVCLPALGGGGEGKLGVEVSLYTHKVLGGDSLVGTGTLVVDLGEVVETGECVLEWVGLDAKGGKRKKESGSEGMLDSGASMGSLRLEDGGVARRMAVRIMVQVEGNESYAEKKARSVFVLPEDARECVGEASGWGPQFLPSHADEVEAALLEVDHDPGLNPLSVVEENPQELLGMYGALFASAPHTLFVQPSGDGKDGGVVVAVLGSVQSGWLGKNVMAYWTVTFAKSAIRYLCVTVSAKRPLSISQVLAKISPEWGHPDELDTFGQMDVVPGNPGDDAIIDQLVKMETPEPELKVKLGVLLATAGQVEENAMYSNRESTPLFSEFLSLLGDRVQLRGFPGYSAQLDTEHDGSGTHSVYRADFLGHEVMFHVSTELQYDETDEQRIQRKRFIGNDIVVILFAEDVETPFPGECLTSEYTNVLLVVTPVVYQGSPFYRVTSVRKKGVPAFGPLVHALYPRTPGFATFLLTKAINGEDAACSSPEFLVRDRRTRATYLDLFRKSLDASRLGSVADGQEAPWRPPLAPHPPFGSGSAIRRRHGGDDAGARPGIVRLPVLSDFAGHISAVDSVGPYVFLGTSKGVFVYREGSSAPPELTVPLQNVIQIGVDTHLGVLYIRTSPPQDHMFAITVRELISGEDPTVVMLTPLRPTYFTWGVSKGRNVVVVVVGRGEGLVIFDATTVAFRPIKHLHMPSTISSVCLTETGLYIGTTGERTHLAASSPFEDFVASAPSSARTDDGSSEHGASSSSVSSSMSPSTFHAHHVSSALARVIAVSEKKESERRAAIAAASTSTRSFFRFRSSRSSGSASSSGKLDAMAASAGAPVCGPKGVQTDAATSFSGTGPLWGPPASYFVDMFPDGGGGGGSGGPRMVELSREGTFAAMAVAALRLATGMVVAYPTYGVLLDPSGRIDRRVDKIWWTSQPRAFLPLGPFFVVVYELYVEVYSGVAGALVERIPVIVDVPNEVGSRGGFVTVWEPETRMSRVEVLVFVRNVAVPPESWVAPLLTPEMEIRTRILIGPGDDELEFLFGGGGKDRWGESMGWEGSDAGTYLSGGGDSRSVGSGALSPRGLVSAQASMVSLAVERALQQQLSKAARRQLHKMRSQASALKRWRRRRRRAREANKVSSLSQVGADVTYVPPPQQPGVRSCRYCVSNGGLEASSAVRFVDISRVLAVQDQTGDPASFYADRLLDQLAHEQTTPASASVLGGLTPLAHPPPGGGPAHDRGLDEAIWKTEVELAELDRILHFVAHSNLFPTRRRR